MKKIIIKKLQNMNHGFTLLELLVSLFVITMLAGIFLANYRGGSQSTDLTFAAQGVTSDIHAAVNNSLGFVAYGGSLPAGGWGIHFTKGANSYIIFADVNKNKLYNSGEADPALGGRVIALPKNLIISELLVGGAWDVDITFLPPDPKITMYHCGGAATSSSVIIRLKDTVSGKTKDVNMNLLGMVGIQ
jgi:prepilin-type N-terminal cleavage/methylation domain-containing protein